jgi:hypothetical protein
VADSTALDAGPELTLEAWVRPTTLTGYRMILDKTTTGEPANYYLALVGGVVEFGFRASTGWREHRVSGGIGPTVGAWTHVAATYSDASDRVRIYVNGVEVLSGSESASLVPNGEQLRLGVGFPDEGFAGRLDEVRLYRRMLTAVEIQADMNRPVSGSTSPTSTTSSTSTLPTSTSSTTSSSSSSSSTSTTTSSTQAPPSTTSSTTTSTVATSSTMVTSTTTSTTVPAGLVAAYGFEEGSGTAAGDGSGAGNAGTLVGAQWTAAGRYGGGVELDGLTDFVAVEASPTLDGGAQVSLEAWVNPTRVDGYRVVLDKTVGGQPSNYYMAVVDGELEFGFFDASDGIWSSHTTNGAGLRAGIWSHLAAVYRDDLDTVTLYIDGAQVLSRTETRSLPVNDGELRIGIGFPEEAFAGRIDEVRVYQRARTVTEIRTDMTTPVVPR